MVHSYFNKHTISWELIHRRLLHPSDGVMKEIFRHQTINGLPKHFPKKINQVPYKIWYT